MNKLKYEGIFEEEKFSSKNFEKFCEINAPMGTFNFSLGAGKFHFWAFPGVITDYNLFPYVIKEGINGEFTYLNEDTLWKVEYRINDLFEYMPSVLVDISRLEKTSPITIEEAERMREVIRTADTIDKLLSWL